MRVFSITALIAFSAAPLLAQEHREIGAHEHGVGQFNIALDGDRVAMELHAPGADIVGFEHAAERAEDRAAIDAAVAMLARPLDLFVLPVDAQCSVTQASAGLVATEEAEHGDHDDHDHDHAEVHDHADEHGHETADHGARHSEFHADYLLTCANPAALTSIDFAFFASFPNARTLNVQMISNSGAARYVVERDMPVLDLAGRI